MASAASLLAQIDTAIEALLTGGAESYTIGTRSVTKLDLDTLFKQRDSLRIQANREAGGSIFSLARLGRTSR
jgi:hypothetical protein